MSETTTEGTYWQFMFTLNCLAGELEIHPTLLMEDDALPLMIKAGIPYDELISYLSDRF